MSKEFLFFVKIPRSGLIINNYYFYEDGVIGVYGDKDVKTKPQEAIFTTFVKEYYTYEVVQLTYDIQRPIVLIGHYPILEFINHYLRVIGNLRQLLFPTSSGYDISSFFAHHLFNGKKDKLSDILSKMVEIRRDYLIKNLI